MVDSQDTRPPARPLPMPPPPAPIDSFQRKRIVPEIESPLWATRFVAKADSRLMRVLGRLLGKNFMHSFWTTIGSRVYVPSNDLPAINEPELGSPAWQVTNREAITHETIHLGQFARHGVLLMAIAYALPYFRWRIERVAYLTNIMAQPPAQRGKEIDWVVDTLSSAYFWPWPKTWMRAWFVDAIAQGGQEK